jgi:tripartite-type tricarboxylate transporter receptor subunit TctC
LFATGRSFTTSRNARHIVEKVMRRFWSSLLLSVLVCGVAAHAHAAWPEKPVTITVGFGAGGTTDVVARVVGEALSRQLGQPVVIENKPGAGGAVAATALMKAAPDGYNLVANTSTTMTFDPHATQLTFGVDDFVYLAAIGEFPEGYIALPDKGWKTLNDALAAGKDKGLNYASTTSIDRVVTALIAKKSGTQLAAVPTRGGAEAVTQVMGGHVDLAYSSGAYIPQAKAGQVKVLAVLSDKRLPDLPDVPTLLELGFGLSSVNLILFQAPKNLPADIRDKLVSAFTAAAKDEKVVDLMKARSLGNTLLFGDKLTEVMRSQSAQFKDMIARSKAQ